MELRDPRPQALAGAADGGADPAGVRAAVAVSARVVLLAGPTVVGFYSGGYFEGARLVAAIAAWIVVAVLALAVGGSAVPRGAAARLALGGMAALTVWVAISRSWAPLAGPAGEDAQRDALYLGALLAGSLAWRRRAWADRVEAALAGGIVVVVGYGVLGRVLPGVVDPQASIAAGGRLDQPLTYWNAMGALAAMGIVLCARLAGDARRPVMWRLGAAAALPLLCVGIYLTYSRGALAAVACGLIVLGLLAPTWEQARALAIGLGLGAVACLVASRLDGVASLSGSAGHREAQGLAMGAVLIATGLAGAALQRRALHASRRGSLGLPRWVLGAGAVAAVLVALFPYGAAVIGERGEASPAFGASAARLSSVGSNRYAYWRVAVDTFVDHPLRGTGSASFRGEWLRERPFRESVRDAHSLYLETLAELGLVGLVLLAALLAGVALALVRTLRDEAALAVGSSAALTVWAVHAGVDWDWEMPGVTLVAVALAGMLLARCGARARG